MDERYADFMTFDPDDKQLPDLRVSLADALDSLRLAIVEAVLEKNATYEAAKDRPERLPELEVKKSQQQAEWKVACLVAIYDQKDKLLSSLPEPVKPEAPVLDRAGRRRRLGRK